MFQFTRYCARCGLAIWLFFFAMTADVIVKSIVSGGFDANKPAIQIEHKCADKAAKITLLNKELSQDFSISAPQALSFSSRDSIISDIPAHTDPAISFALPDTPLRC